MKIERQQNLTTDQKEQIVRLWNDEYPQQLKYDGVSNFEEFLNKIINPQHFLIFDENKNIKGWLASFTRHGEVWFSMIVDGTVQKKGYGTRLLNKVKKFENEINGWAVDHDNYLKSSGEKYLSPIEFYKKNNFAVINEERLEKQEISAVKIKWKK